MCCSIVGCNATVEARGWCQKHYLRWYNHGDPLQTSTPNRRAPGEGSQSNGYKILPQVGPRGTKSPGLAHRVLAEKVLGRKLLPDEVVHHVNEDPLDNRHANLLICTRSYHKLLHMRMQALADCGHANYRKCPYCKTYDDPVNMGLHGRQYRHKVCHAKNMQAWKQRV